MTALQDTQTCTSLRSLTIMRSAAYPESIKRITSLDIARPIFQAAPLCLRFLTIQYAQGGIPWWSQIRRYERLDGMQEGGITVAVHEVVRPKAERPFGNPDKKSRISHFTFSVQK